MEVEPLLLSVPQTSQTIGRCVATVYDLIGAGVLDARKSDGRTLVTMESIKHYVADLPKAEIMPRPKRKPQHLRQAEADKPQQLPQMKAKTGPPRERRRLRQAESETANA
jgi:hypothetical protein